MLNKSKVYFDEITHSYWLEGKRLSGITEMLSRQSLSTQYIGVSDAVLENAQERGTAIHRDIEIENINSEYQEVNNFFNLIKSYGLTICEHEYLVSDNEHYASSIDVVFNENNGTYSLADIKTTAVKNYHYVAWQLSVYSYLFRLQNPQAKVSKIYLIWLRGEIATMEELHPFSDAEVKDLLLSDIEGRIYGQEYMPIKVDKPMLTLMGELTELYKLSDEIKIKEKEVKEFLLREMENRNLTSIEIGNLKITYKRPYTAERFDTDRLKKEIPNIDEYKKYSAVKGSITIKIK